MLNLIANMMAYGFGSLLSKLGSKGKDCTDERGDSYIILNELSDRQKADEPEFNHEYDAFDGDGEW